MARKIIDIQPVLTARFIGGGTVTTEADAKAQVQDAIDMLEPDFECSIVYETDDRCEHCNSVWTEAGADYNGGCCGLDEANNPERLKEMAEVADAISAETFYRYEEGQRGRVAVNWPDQFGAAVATWLEAGRPAADAERLLTLAKRVASGDWCTVWSDPGPSGCSLARLPDRVTQDARPEQLADELLSLLDDMNLLPARKAVA